MPAGVSPSDARYTSAQRLAFGLHYDPPRVTSRMVAELAESGRLTGPDGRRLPAFSVNPGSVRGIARRVQRGRDLEGAGPESTRRLSVRLAGRARRLAANAKTAAEISAAAKALEDAERLRGAVEQSSASNGGGLRDEVLRAHRGGGPPVPAELPKPEPKPEPPAPEPESPGEWMRRELGRMARSEPAASAVPLRSSAGGAVDDSDIERAVLGHPAFGLHGQSRRRGRIPGGDMYDPDTYARQRGYGRPR